MHFFAIKFCILVEIGLILLTHGANGAKKQIPPYVKKCSAKSEPKQFQKCFHENLVILKPKLAAGIPEMRIPAIDPLYLEEIDLGLDNFKSKFTKVNVHGASVFQVKQMNFDLQTRMLNLKLLFPKIDIDGLYIIKGRLLLINLDSTGPYTHNMSDVMTDVELKGKLETIKGKTHIKFDEQKIKLDVQGYHRINFEQLFKNNPELGRNTNQVINDNIKEVTKDFLPLVEQIVSSFVIGVVQQVFKAFSLEDLFLDYP